MDTHAARRQSGQVAVLFAIAAIGVVAIVGLALDAGQAFVAQRALQGGADTVAQSGAAMLLEDYTSCVSTPTTGDSPYTPAEIYSDLVPLLAKDAAAQGKATEPPQLQFVNYQGHSLGLVDAGYLNPFCTSGVGWTGPAGIEVVTKNTHHTTLLGVVGIHTASESATATALVGQVTGAAAVPFGVWSMYCPTSSTTPVAPYDPVVLQSSQWKGTTCGPNAYTGRGSFKGYFKLTAPVPVTSGTGCIQTGPGSGDGGTSSNPPSPGTLVYVPLITSVTSFGNSPPPGCPSLSVRGTFDLTYSGFVAVLISPPPSASRVEGVVQKVVANLSSGLVICPIRDPACPSPSVSGAYTFYLWK